jgi:AraC-like DNA-binding protein
MSPAPYIEQTPTALLSRFVRRVWMLDVQHAAPTPELIIPDGCCEIVLSAGDRVLGGDQRGELILRPLDVVVGQMRRPTLVQPLGRTRLTGIRLHPWATPQFLGCSASEVGDSILDLRDVVPELGALLREAIDPTLEAGESMAGVMGILQRHAASREQPDPRISHAVRAVRHSRLSMRKLAPHLGWSERRLQRVFRVQIGIGPKFLFRITRVQLAVQLAQANRDWPWAAIAAHCGFVDQPHLIREFRKLAGCTPTALRKEPSNIRDRLLLRD